MKSQTLTEVFQIWIGAVEVAAASALERLRRPRRVRLIEDDNSRFRIETPQPSEPLGPNETLIKIQGGVVDEVHPAAAAILKGSRVELILRSSRFVFRALEVPERAADFLDGIVRAQIDRLTPWTANQAAFGWISTVAAPERMSLTVCATARATVTPYVNALADFEIESVVVSTFPEGDAAQTAPVRVLEDRSKHRLTHDRVRRGLTGLLLFAVLAAAGAGIANEFIAEGLDAKKANVVHDISQLRSGLRRDGSPDVSPAQDLLQQRKRETPSAVIVLEALSRILPDHTYVTELRVEGDKVQIVGITHDAPLLIRLIEQSPNFTRATFFAPTTSTTGEPGEHFHIEAHIKPVFAVGT